MRCGGPLHAALVAFTVIALSTATTLVGASSIGDKARPDDIIPKGDISHGDTWTFDFLPYGTSVDITIDPYPLPSYTLKANVRGVPLFEFGTVEYSSLRDAQALLFVAALASEMTLTTARQSPLEDMVAKMAKAAAESDDAFARTVAQMKGSVDQDRIIGEILRWSGEDMAPTAEFEARPTSGAAMPSANGLLKIRPDGIAADASASPNGERGSETRVRIDTRDTVQSVGNVAGTNGKSAQGPPPLRAPIGDHGAASDPSTSTGVPSSRVAGAGPGSFDKAPAPAEGTPTAPLTPRIASAAVAPIPTAIDETAIAAAGAAGFLAFLSFLLWSHRQSRADVLNHPNRQAIYAAIRAEQGIHLVALAKRAQMDLGVARYHVNLLEKAEMITMRRAGRYLAYFTNPAPTREAQSTVGVLKDPTRKRVATAIIGAPKGLTQAQLASTVGVTQRTVSHHLKKLETADLVEAAGWPRQYRGTHALRTGLDPVMMTPGGADMFPGAPMGS